MFVFIPISVLAHLIFILCWGKNPMTSQAKQKIFHYKGVFLPKIECLEQFKWRWVSISLNWSLLYINIRLIWLQTSTAVFFSYQPEMQTLVNKIQLSLWKIIRAYTQKTHLLSSTMHLRRFFNWKNSVRFSFFLGKLRIESSTRFLSRKKEG